MAEAQQLFDLKRCIETGLEQNYSIRIIRNEQQISDNNATPGNAGYLPTVDMSGGFSGNINNNRNSPQDGSIEKANGINSETGNVGLNVNWTVFDGFGIQAEYSRLKELQRMGELNTRMTIEDFADLTGIELEDGPYETVAGYFLAHSGKMGEVGDHLVVDDAYTMTITKVDGRRIETIEVRKGTANGGTEVSDDQQANDPEHSDK